MFKRFNSFDKTFREYTFNSGSDGSLPVANMQNKSLVQNREPYDDDNEVRFGIKGSTFLPDYFNETDDWGMIASGSSTFGQIKSVIESVSGLRREEIYGLADHHARFFTSFQQNVQTQVPLLMIVPYYNSKLMHLPASSFTVEIKYYPEKAGGPNDGVCNLTLTGSGDAGGIARLSGSFIDSDLISFHSISQDNQLRRQDPDYSVMDVATASFHYRFAGDDSKVAMPSGMTAFQNARKRYYGHPNPIIEIFGMSGSDGQWADKFPVSLSRNDPSVGGRPPAWKRPGVLSSSVGYHLSCSKWHYSYISWRTGSNGPSTASLKFDKFGLKNGFIGGVVNYNKDEDGNQHFATYSIQDPGQLQNVPQASQWTNVTGSQNFRKLGTKMGMIQLGGKLTPRIIEYPSGQDPRVRGPRHSDVDIHKSSSLGAAISGSNPYYGGIKELRIWNKALDHNTLGSWSLKELDQSHPYMKNLVGYWKFDIKGGNPEFQVYGLGSGIKLTKPKEFRWRWPTSSFVVRQQSLAGKQNAYFVCQPQSGSGYLANNDSSSFTAMAKIPVFPGLTAPGVTRKTSVRTPEGKPIGAEVNYTVPGPSTAYVRNQEWYTNKWNPFKVVSIPFKMGGIGLLTGSTKFQFDLGRVAGCPVISPSSLGPSFHAFDDADFLPADGKKNVVDRDGGNKIIRPSMYALPRGKVNNKGTASFMIDWVDNGSGLIAPPLNYTNVENRPCGVVAYGDGLMLFRDSTYDGLHNFYIYEASAPAYPKGSSEIDSTTERSRADWAATASGFFNAKYSYSGSLKVRRLQLDCRAGFNEFNSSTNKTFGTAFNKVNKVFGISGSVTYISSIGLYDDDGNCVAVGKLAKPLRKEPDQAITTKLRLDL